MLSGILQKFLQTVGGFDAKSKLVNQLIDIVDFGNIAATCSTASILRILGNRLLPANNLELLIIR